MALRKAGALLSSEVTILRALQREPMHAYVLAPAVGMPYRTVVNAVARLIAMGHLAGRWDLDHGQPRRVVRLTANGRRALREADVAE